MSRIGTMAVVAAMVVGLAAAQAAALNVDSVSIVSVRNRLDGYTAGWAINFGVSGTGITNVKARNVDNGREFALTYQPVPNRWQFDNTFSSLGLFESIHPSAPTNYQLLFNETAPNVFEDEVLLGFAVNEPRDYAHITYPLHNQTGVSQNPTYTWDNTLTGLGLYALGMEVRDAGLNQLYRVYPEFNTGLLSWTPGPIGDGGFSVIVEDYRITGGQPLTLPTLNGDEFVYTGLRGQSNQVDFTTLPEPATMALVGSGLLGLVGWRRRRRMQ